MENKIVCTLKEHNDIDAKIFCQDCKIYMCNKCYNHHSNIFKNHHIINSEKDLQKIFTGFCEEKEHFDKLEFFCKNHNKLCCAACLSKIKDKGKGQHTDCEVCIIDNIKNEKIKKLNKNIQSLEDLTNDLQETIKNLKDIFEKMNENKENLKEKIQTIFTKLRNCLNDREEELLLEVDKKYNDLFFDENTIKEGERLSNSIKINFDKGKQINNDSDKVPLNEFINDCINIEDNINKINSIKEKVLKCNLLKDFNLILKKLKRTNYSRI